MANSLTSEPATKAFSPAPDTTKTFMEGSPLHLGQNVGHFQAGGPVEGVAHFGAVNDEVTNALLGPRKMMFWYSIFSVSPLQVWVGIDICR